MCLKKKIPLTELLYELAKEWRELGVKYEHRGCTRFGCDCTGLIIGILRELGYLKKYVLRNYQPDWNLHAKADDYILQEIRKVADKIEEKDKMPGDIVTFYFGKCVAHVGIIVENNMFIHCHVKAKKCTISSLYNSSWTKRIDSFYHLNEKKLESFS